MKIIFDHGMEWKISQVWCSGYREAIITRIQSIKQKDKESCTGVIRKKLYELDHFLSLYDVDRPINYFMIDRAEKLKPANHGQFSIFSLQNWTIVCLNYPYNELVSFNRTDLPSDSLKKERLCLKIVLGQA